jgi:hydrogenase small subunit
MERYPQRYLAVVEGAIPTADDGVACLVGGRPIREVVREVCEGAAMTIAVGSCAFDGGASAASGGGTGAVGVAQVAPGARLVALPGCPLNADNLAATIVHYLTFKEPPPTDGRQRPYFAYGGLIHNQCERRSAFEFGQFVQAWGDEGAQKGWCLYKLGCKGPQSFANCPTARYAEKTSWPVRAGHGCIACTMPGFWDAMGAAYVRLPSPLPFAPQVTVDQVGMLVVGGIAGVTMVHGSLSVVRSRRSRAAHRRAAAAAASAPGQATLAAGTPGDEAVAAVAPPDVAEPAAPRPAPEPEAPPPDVAPLPGTPSSGPDPISGESPR